LNSKERKRGRPGWLDMFFAKGRRPAFIFGRYGNVLYANFLGLNNKSKDKPEYIAGLLAENLHLQIFGRMLPWFSVIMMIMLKAILDTKQLSTSMAKL
jgi:hypothetical protein